MRTDQLCREFDLQPQYICFPLHPETPDEGLTLDELFAGRFDIDAMLQRLRQVAASLGLPFGDRTHTYNSRRAQELGKWAEQQGAGAAFHAAVYHAYFSEGLNIAQLDVLAELAEHVDLDPDSARQVLREQRFAAAVDNDWRQARSSGISAVPTLVYGEQRLAGFAPYENYRNLVEGRQ